jgi:GxxExxY protein
MPKRQLLHEELTSSIIGGFYEVYNTLGYGFVEEIHVRALVIELQLRGHRVHREYPVVVYYKGRPLMRQRLDLLVDDLVILECKSTEKLDPNAMRKVPNYLKSTDFEVGLLLHFGPKPKFYRSVHLNSDKTRREPVVSGESAKSDVIRVQSSGMPVKHQSTTPEQMP